MLADSRHPKVSWTGAGSSQGTGGVKCHRLPFMYTNTPPSSPSQRFEIPIRLCCLPRRGRNARSPQYKGGLGGGGGAEPCSQGRDSGVGGGAPSPVCSCANTARWGLGVRSDSPPFSFLSPPGVLLRWRLCAQRVLPGSGSPWRLRLFAVTLCWGWAPPWTSFSTPTPSRTCPHRWAALPGTQARPSARLPALPRRAVTSSRPLTTTRWEGPWRSGTRRS